MGECVDIVRQVTANSVRDSFESCFEYFLNRHPSAEDYIGAYFIWKLFSYINKLHRIVIPSNLLMFEWYYIFVMCYV